MIRKLIPLLLISCFSLPSFASAYSVISEENNQGIKTNGPFYFSERDEVRIEFQTNAVYKTQIDFYHDAGYTKAGSSKTNTAPGGQYYIASGFTCVGWYDYKAYGENDELVYSLKLQVDEGDLISPKCNSTPSPDDVIPVECDACALLECPGWGDFMGKLEDIKAAIPPPPNWNEVSGIFRDTIAPQIKKDLAEVIGTAPEPIAPTTPNTPNVPGTPSQLPQLDDRGFKAPAGNEAPGLEDSGFSSDDIKAEAPKIPERTDPTGGFNISDPVSGLPSQEEFLKNVPEEGEAPLPKPPKDPENTAPTPGDTNYTAPTPGDTGDTAPTPGDTGDTAPTPGDTGDTAPIPGEDSQYTAPIP